MLSPVQPVLPLIALKFDWIEKQGTCPVFCVDIANRWEEPDCGVSHLRSLSKLKCLLAIRQKKQWKVKCVICQTDDGNSTPFCVNLSSNKIAVAISILRVGRT